MKGLLGGETKHLDEAGAVVQQRLPVLVRSMDSFYETSNPRASKAQALRLVLTRLDVDPSACVGIGDGDTDLEWLATIGLPVAVANARPRVRAAAARVIGHHATEGVAKFLEEFFELTAHRR